MFGQPSDFVPFPLPAAYYFDGGRFEPHTGILAVGGGQLRLRPKTAGVLSALLDRAGDLVTKAELVDLVWGGAAGDDSLAVCVAELRRALHDDPRRPRLLATVHRRGYCFIAAVSTSPQPAEPPPPPDLIGREADLAELTEWWRSARSGSRTLGFVAAEAGAGRTALVRTFLADVQRGEPAAIGEGRCVERDGGEPDLPILDVLVSLCRGRNGGSRFRELLRDLAPSWLVRLPGLVDGAMAEELQRRSDRFPDRRLHELADALDALSSAMPVLVVLEDLHVADPATAEMLAYLAQRPTSARLLVLATYRRGDVRWPGRGLGDVVGDLRALRRCEHRELAPLDEVAIAALLELRLAPAVPEGQLVRQVLERTEGNALFATALIDGLIADDALAVVEGSVRPRLPIAESAIPRDVRQLVAQQVAAFDEADRVLLLAAAAAGVEFTAVEAAAGVGPLTESVGRPDDLGNVERRLSALAMRSGLLAEVEPAPSADGRVSTRFRFRHVLVREVLHEQLGGAKRVLVHRAIGAMLEAAAPDARAAASIATHFELGHDPARAAVNYARAAAVAWNGLAPSEALDLARRGVALAAASPSAVGPDVRLGLQLSLVGATLAVHGVGSSELAAAVDDAEDAVDAAAGADPGLVGQARYLFWSIAFMAGEISVAGARIRPLEAAVATAGGGLLAHQLASARSVTSFASGAPVVALEQASPLHELEAGFEAPGDASRTWREIAMLNRWSVALASWLVGRPDDARRLAHDGLRIARELGEARLLCASLWPVAAVHQLRGERRRVTWTVEEIRRAAEPDGRSHWRLVGGVFEGWASATGDDADGRSHALQVRACLDGLVGSLGFGTPYHLALLAEAATAGGDGEAARAAIDEGLQAVEATGDRWYLAELLRLLGESMLHSAIGESMAHRGALRRAAAEVFTEAVTVARTQGATALELRAIASRERASRGIADVGNVLQRV